MTKEKIESNKQDLTKKYKIAVSILSVALIAVLSCCGVFIYSGKIKTLEEEKYLEVFKSLSEQYAKRYQPYHCGVDDSGSTKCFDEAGKEISEEEVYDSSTTFNRIALTDDLEFFVDFTVHFSNEDSLEPFKSRRGREIFRKCEFTPWNFCPTIQWEDPIYADN